MPTKKKSINKSKRFILWFNELTNQDVPLVGGKNASLGEMYQNLTKRGIIIPNGFAVTAHAYRFFIKEAGLEKEIRRILKGLDTHDIANLSKKGREVREAILRVELPKKLQEEVVAAYEQLCREDKQNNVDVAVRSSATAEDLPNASFAGQQETYLNIRGSYALLEAVKKCIASLFTDRAISYREDKGFSHFTIALSVGVQKMVRSDKAISGVMFSLDTESGFQGVVMINASYGLGENIVKGVVSPDEYYVFKETMAQGYKSIISKNLGTKKKKLIYSVGGTKPTVNVDVPTEDQRRYCLKDSEIMRLAKWAVVIEKHYDRPMDMEWAKDGDDNKLYIVQARPETVHSIKDRNVLEDYIIKKKGKVILEGQSVGRRIGQGLVNVIKDVSEIERFKKGQVLVTEMTDPDWEPIMKIAAAIVTNSGGRTCHAAIVSRELGIPCVVGTKKGTEVLKDGKKVTVSCAEGEVGRIYQGILPFEVKRTNIGQLKRPKTKIMMNVGDPEQAMSVSFIPNDGVGLAREEFIISNYIKIHPLALIHFNKVEDVEEQEKIKEITAAYKNKTKFYIDKLAEGIGRIAAAFYPKEVIVRLTDFKSNEYANLIGGKYFEPKEANPMLGWRGASRYYDEKYKEGFILECQALKKARDEMGLKNIKVMVPFCRTIQEGKKVLKIMEENGLKRGVDDLEVYVMCEIPSNVILADGFARIFDGFSIGTNDLTQLTLGVDRDSDIVAHVYDERNQAVKDLVSQVIQVAHKRKRKIGICGQAPSDFPEFARFLVKEGIDSMSLNPDTVVKTTLDLAKIKK